MKFTLVNICLSLTLLSPAAMASDDEGAQKESGRALFNSGGCYACHSTQGSGGCLGPPLDGIKSRRNYEFVFSRIANSPSAVSKFQKLYNKPELMEHPRVSAQSAEKISKYLLSLPEYKENYTLIPHPPGLVGKPDKHFVPHKETASSKAGAKLFYERGCISCHSVNGLGGWIGPELNGVGTRLSADTIKFRIKSGGFKVEKMPGEKAKKVNVMPKATATPKEIDQITDFLLTLPQ
jgi:cytochrome c2